MPIKEMNIQETITTTATNLQKLVEMYNADGIKVYFKDEHAFCIKIIKDEKVIKCIRRGSKRQQSFDKSKDEVSHDTSR